MFRAMANHVELFRPNSQELHPIAAGKSWGTIEFIVKDYSIKPILFAHLKRLPADFDVRMVALTCSDWSDEYQKLDVLRVVVNGDTFVWAEDAPNFEGGKIEIVGNTEIVKAIGSQICEDSQAYEMPAIKEIFPPKTEWPGWVEAVFGRGRLDLGKLRQSLSGFEGIKVSTYVPIEDFRQEALFRLFAVINGNTFLRANMDGYQLLGSKDTVSQVAMKLKQQLGGKLFDWTNLDVEGRPSLVQ